MTTSNLSMSSDDDTSNPTSESSKGDITTWLMPCVLAVAAGVLSSWWFHQQTAAELTARLDDGPKIAVMGYADLLTRLPLGTPQEDMNKVLMAAKAEAEAMRQDGYVVVDGGAVITAPEALYVNFDRIIEKAGIVYATEKSAQN